MKFLRFFICTSFICASFIFTLGISLEAQAASSSTFKWPGQAWLALGKGSMNVKTPKNVENIDGSLMASIGVEFNMPSWILLAFGVAGQLSVGNIDYDYTGSDNIEYKASDVKFASSTANMQLGLNIRIINGNSFHFYIGGGGLMGAETLRFDDSGTTLPTQGTKYIKEEKSIKYSGSYGEAGFDLLTNGDKGLRVGGHVENLATGATKTIANEKRKMSDAYVFLAYIHSL